MFFILLSDPYDMLNGRNRVYPQHHPYTQLIFNPITAHIPAAQPDLTHNAERPRSDNHSTTESPTLNSGVDTYHTEDNPADPDQTLLKILATDANPPDMQPETISLPSPTESQDTTPEPTDSPSSGSEVSFHRVRLNRVQGVPMTLMTMQSLGATEGFPAETETSFMNTEQASPDPVITEPLVITAIEVTEPLVTMAPEDETARPSITRSKCDVHIYRRDVNQPVDNAAIAIQPVPNIPQVYGIQVRENSEEYLAS